MVRLAVDVIIAVTDVFCEMKIELNLLSQVTVICKLYLASLTRNTIGSEVTCCASHGV
jgi:hypothetical protein